MRQAFAKALLCSASVILFTPQLAQAEATGGFKLRPFVGLGFTSGGDTLQPVTLIPEGTTTEYKENVSAGGGIEARVGLALRMSGLPVSLRASVGAHNDQVNGSDGEKVYFRRFPLELQAMWHMGDRFSVGLGVRKATRARLTYKNVSYTDGSGDTQTIGEVKTRFTSSLGLALEAEYALTPSWSISGRYVREHFKTEGSAPERADADHVGITTQWYFN